jgi:hypothetical protein
VLGTATCISVHLLAGRPHQAWLCLPQWTREAQCLLHRGWKELSEARSNPRIGCGVSRAELLPLGLA